jgi:hypothetical protein
LTTDFSILYVMGGVIGFVFIKGIWNLSDRFYTEKAEGYWARQYLDYSNKPMGDMI